ncbi:hypothetical protein J4465_00905 [Candidatus Pacearchaeota archaeon]|nr:hypothetical protein [Candidatus Pacearchaeota archaeon]
MAKRNSIFLFCIPGEIYKGKFAEEVAKIYTEMTIKDYNSFVIFDPKYENYKKTPDVQDFGLTKEKTKIFRNLFLYQQMTKVGKVYGLINSSRHLFSPEGKSEGEFYPDLNVIEFHERKKTQVDEVKSFYESYGWNVFVYDHAIRKSVWISKRGRFANAPHIVSTKALLNVAEEHFRYDSKKLYWT